MTSVSKSPTIGLILTNRRHQKNHRNMRGAEVGSGSAQVSRSWKEEGPRGGSEDARNEETAEGE